LKLPDLQNEKLTETSEECELAASGFWSISCKEVIPNCVGLLDGSLLKIDTPRKRKALNVKSYYSGHYQCNGVNIQAIVDHHCQFTYSAVAAPGSTGDNDAINQISLASNFAALSMGYCIIADAVYTAMLVLINWIRDMVISIYMRANVVFISKRPLGSCRWSGHPLPASKLLAQESQVPSPLSYCLSQKIVVNEYLGGKYSGGTQNCVLSSIWASQEEDGNPIAAREEMARNVEQKGLTRPVGWKLH
jgi:hypothetical protein